MPADTFASLNRRIDRFQKELGSKAMADAVGMMAKEAATDAASADLGGDPKFSGWAPTLDTRYDVIDGGPSVLLKPTKRSAGPWTVAQFGRNQAAGPRFTSNLGPRLTQTGRISRRRVGRWNGRTQPKYTADDAHALIDKRLPKVADKQVGRAIRRSFG